MDSSLDRANDDEPQPTLERAGKRQSFLCIAGRQHGVARLRQNPSYAAPHQRVVVHNENHLGAWGHGWGSAVWNVGDTAN
jgi:hypothetical protein